MKRSDFRYFHPFRVRYAEVDGQGVVFNAHYLTYYDTAITEYLYELGYDYIGAVKETGEDYHLVKSLVEYKAPIYLRDEIEVGVRPGRLGSTSLTFELAIFRKGEDTLLATGEIVWVNVDQTTHQTAPLPDEIVAKIRAFEGDKSVPI